MVMLPKDLLNDLEKGDRVMEFLEIPDENRIVATGNLMAPTQWMIPSGAFGSGIQMANQQSQFFGVGLQQQLSALGGFIR